ncbi:hypothetical protein [Geothrix paludis]|uniref:hypothetical protein n=1 Tax=Geothrix paludis TaxID=2922722 RepID=UPI001FADADEC|nr:hypothetical protein [Geothrix paludis]
MPTVRSGRPAWRVPLSAGLLSVLAWGCATPHPLAYTPAVPEPVRRGAVAVAVVPVAPEPGTQAQLGGEIGKGRAAGKGAATGAATGATAGFLASLQTGPFFVILAPILVPAATVIGGASGAAVGYAHGMPTKDAATAKAVLARNQTDLSAELAKGVVQRLPGTGKILAAPGAAPDLRVEVSVLSWGLYGGAGSHPVADFELTVLYRVLDQKGTVLLARQFSVGGPRRPLQEWGTEDGKRLQEAVGATLDSAAEAIADSAFLIQDFFIAKELGPATCGLLPRRPRPVLPPTLLPFGGASPQVESLRPVLQWEAFPRREDLEHDAGGLFGRITDVRYDLRIWASVGGGPGPLVYERTGLRLDARRDPVGATPPSEGKPPQPVEKAFVEHGLDAALAPATEYLWSVRARFRLDGEERASRWSMNQTQDPRTRPATERWFSPPMSARGPCLHDGIPPLRYHRFRTP